MEIILPTPQRIAKGDIIITETERGGYESKSVVLQYHDKLLKDGLMTATQWVACQRFIELHHGVFAPMGYRSVHELLLRRAEGGRSCYIEGALTKEDQYFKIIHALDFSERVAVIGLLIEDETIECVAARMYRGRKQVKHRLISAAQKIAEQFREMRDASLVSESRRA